jgi:hypothetical protein
LKVSSGRQAIEHEPSSSEINHKFGGLNAVFIVFAEATITAEPSKAALRDPGQARDLECALLSFHDLQLPAIPVQEIAGQLSAFVARVGENRSNPWEQRTQATEQASSGTPIRYVRWLNPTSYWKPQRVNQNVTLTSFDALVRIKAACAAALGGLYRLCVHDHHARAWCPPGCNTRLLVQRASHLDPNTGIVPGPEVMVDGPPWGKLARQQPPLASGTQ